MAGALRMIGPAAGDDGKITPIQVGGKGGGKGRGFGKGRRGRPAV